MLLHDLAVSLRRLADRLDPLPSTSPAPVEMPGVYVPVSEDFDKADDAMSILDEACLGYLIVRVQDAEEVAEIRLAGRVPEQFWPAVSATLMNIVRATARR